jgi:mono/diheme cytochrome c family protein
MNTKPNNRATDSREVEYRLQKPFVKWQSILATGAIVILATSAVARQTIKATAGNSQNGKAVYEKLGCNQCHGAQGEGLSAAGSNAGVPRIASTGLSFADFLQQVRKPKGQMPPFSTEKVSNAELTDVYAYLQSLQPVSEQPVNTASASKGERLYKNYGCYECHGFQGQGSASTGGARLGPPRIPLSAFVSYIRQPTGEMPPYTAKVVSDDDASEIYNFLKSIPPPPPLKSIPLLNQ